VPTPNEAAIFSQAVYTGPGAEIPGGWDVVGESPTNNNGYYGIAYANRESGEVVIANRGSRDMFNRENFAQDWVGQDARIAVGNLASTLDKILPFGGFGLTKKAADVFIGAPPAFKNSDDFASSIVNDSRFAGSKVTFVGHSLGGAHAQMQAAKFRRPAVTFGAPGVAGFMDAASARRAQSLVTNYTMLQDPVTKSGVHAGKTVNLFQLAVPHKMGGYKAAIDDKFRASAIRELVKPPPPEAIRNVLKGSAPPPIAMLAAAQSGNLPASVTAPGAGRPQARITDMHVCPMVTGLVPHVGGPIAKGCPTVLVGKLPAARVTDVAVCTGPPDMIAKGSATVFIGKLPAARIGDMTAHGGMIVAGLPTVMTGG
jgi:uncharacterized Zn-binding protein involved in type VI secretion